MSDVKYEEVLTDDLEPSSVDMHIWRKLLRYLSPYRRDIVLMIVAAIVTGVLEPLYALITKWLLDDISANGENASILLWGAGYFAMSVMLALAVATFILYTNKLRVHASHDLRIDAFQNLQRQSFAYFDHRPVGWLVARMTADCERLTNILAWALLDSIWCLTMMLATSVALFWLNWKITLVMMLVMPAIIWISAIFRRTILSSARQVRAANSRITGTFNESIMGVETSKAFVQEHRNAKAFQGHTNTMYQASVKNLTLSAVYVPIIVTASSVSYGITLAFGGSEMLAGSIAVTTLITFMMLVTHFFEPFEIVGHWFAEMQMAQASAERLLGIIEAEPEIKDSASVEKAISLRKDAETNSAIAFDGGHKMIDQIEFKNVGFEYEPGRPVLDDINLSVSRGQTIALVGPTGGGKTTLANVLCRFYEPTRGSLLLDGVDYRNRSHHWLQSNLGIVLQQAHIFSGTVRENIRYGKLSASDVDVERAARMVEADGFIQELENGYDEEVGERIALRVKSS